jgi:hypothetical protein
MENKILEFADILTKGDEPGYRYRFVLKGEYYSTDNYYMRITNYGGDGLTKFFEGIPEMFEKAVKFFTTDLPKLLENLGYSSFFESKTHVFTGFLLVFTYFFRIFRA